MIRMHIHVSKYVEEAECTQACESHKTRRKITVLWNDSCIFQHPYRFTFDMLPKIQFTLFFISLKGQISAHIICKFFFWSTCWREQKSLGDTHKNSSQWALQLCSKLTSIFFYVVCGCWRCSMTIYIRKNLSILSFHLMHNSIFVALIFHLHMKYGHFFSTHFIIAR